MACIDCSCKRVGLHDDTCKELHEMNDSKVKGSSKVLADAELCDYPKIFPKIIYSIWCMFKNIIATICWILARLKDLEDKFNSIIDAYNNMCRAMKCFMEWAKADSEKRQAEALRNVKVFVRHGGSTNGGGATYSKTTFSNDGTLTVQWNMVYASQEYGVGKASLKVNHVYTPNKDGSIDVSVLGFTIKSLDYTGYGFPNVLGDSGKFSIMDNSGKVVYSKTYNPSQSWSETPNTEIKLNYRKKLAPNGGSSGNMKIFSTLDEWSYNPTTANVELRYENGNQPVSDFPCDFDCKIIEGVDKDKIAKDNEKLIHNEN